MPFGPKRAPNASNCLSDELGVRPSMIWKSLASFGWGEMFGAAMVDGT